MDTQQLQEAAQILKSIKPLFENSTNQWIAPGAAILGALAGSVSTIIPNLIFERSKRKAERKNLSNALCAEVHALLNIVRYRRYIESMETALAYVSTLPPGSRHPFIVKVQK